ncbi:type II toxin-antitoxin system HigB family toxin [Bacteroides sp. 519]|nr:type II toxin-antitoxin system HigB family toxin [Bacteroides sp. 519]NDV60715.1 type II toxin-antitoxin system HigB family toxin [Bacteroides sp. 519]
MIIIGSELFIKFCKKHIDAEIALAKWVQEVTVAEWKNHADLKNSFATADYVGNDRYVFNLKGNHYRIVVVVVFFAGSAEIRFIGTHSQYDNIDVKTI